jgi:hypothetical protein
MVVVRPYRFTVAATSLRYSFAKSSATSDLRWRPSSATAEGPHRADDAQLHDMGSNGSVREVGETLQANMELLLRG